MPPFEPPKIYEVESSINNTDTALVFIRGWTTQNLKKPKHQKDWVKKLREAGVMGSIHHLWWDSSDVEGAIDDVFKQKMVWEKAKYRAERSGEQVIELVQKNVHEPKVIFVCHSLGARVLYYSLVNHQHNDKTIRSVLLLGGAIKTDKNWDGVIRNIERKLVNVFSPIDPALIIAKGWSGGKSLVGMKEINHKYGDKQLRKNKIKNIEVNCFHSGYIENLKEKGIHKYLVS